MITSVAVRQRGGGAARRALGPLFWSDLLLGEVWAVVTASSVRGGGPISLNTC